MVVYLIQNLVNGKCYVGQTTQDLHKYFRWNLNYADNGNTGKVLLYRSIRKHGRENFDIRVIHNASSIEDMNNAEKVYIKFFGTRNPELGYNCTDGGEGMCGYTHTEENREKFRKNCLERGLPPGFREGTKKYLKDRVFSAEYRENLSKAITGIKRSQETRKKLSDIGKDRMKDPDIRAKMGSYAKGRIVSEETRRKRSESLRGRKCTPEHIARRVESRLKNKAAKLMLKEADGPNTK